MMCICWAQHTCMSTDHAKQSYSPHALRTIDDHDPFSFCSADSRAPPKGKLSNCLLRGTCQVHLCQSTRKNIDMLHQDTIMFTFIWTSLVHPSSSVIIWSASPTDRDTDRGKCKNGIYKFMTVILRLFKISEMNRLQWMIWLEGLLFSRAHQRLGISGGSQLVTIRLTRRTLLRKVEGQSCFVSL